MSDEEWMVDPSEVEDEMDGILKGMERVRPRWKKAFAIIGLIAVMLAIANVAVGAVLLFTHTLPATPSATAQSVSTLCVTVQENPSTTLLGAAGTILYNCASPSGPTFSANGGPATPSFVPPSGLALSAVPFVSGATSCSVGTVLASGGSVSLASESYDYCGSFSSYPSSGFASFTVSWSQ